MRLRPPLLNAATRLHRTAGGSRPFLRRGLLTLAIESSCDDTSVAILETLRSANGMTAAKLHFHKKVTSDNTVYHGVHPLASLYSHQRNLAGLVDEAILHLPCLHAPDGAPKGVDASSSFRNKRLPDCVSVTRGPGMRSNLSVGLDTAKGLAAAWQVDLVGVNHMAGHALTPRLVAALELAQSCRGSPDDLMTPATKSSTIEVEPNFPFLSVLASGGHTLLIHSASLTEHSVLATTNDIAAGSCLDKIARVVLPPVMVQTARSTMYGAQLEHFAFPEPEPPSSKNTASILDTEAPKATGEFRLEDFTAREYQAIYASKYTYTAPRNNEDAANRALTKWGWRFKPLLATADGGVKVNSLEMSFSGLVTAVERAVQFEFDKDTCKRTKVERSPENITVQERRDLSKEAMRTIFEHIASRVTLGLEKVMHDNVRTPPATIVLSGGVAANSYLRYILASTLIARGFPDVRLAFPPPSLCTDNAAMIAWAGLEMYHSGHKDPRAIRPIRKWPLDQILSPPSEED